MKSARERAEALASMVSAPHTHPWRDLVRAFEASFKEHARDQRHRCVEAQIDSDARRYAMNAPAPGE